MKGIELEAMEFDRLTRVHVTGASRRGVVAGLGRGLVAALSLALIGGASSADAEAKGKKHRRHKHKKKHQQSSGGTPTDPGTPAGPGSPPPPPTTGPGSCAKTGQGVRATNARFSQTFFPPPGGQLLKAMIYLRKNPDNFALGFEIRTVDAAGMPTATVLASKIVAPISQTNFGDPARSVTATFDVPATLTLGQQYALVIKGPGSLYAVSVVYGDDCNDGQ